MINRTDRQSEDFARIELDRDSKLSLVDHQLKNGKFERSSRKDWYSFAYDRKESSRAFGQ